MEIQLNYDYREDDLTAFEFEKLAQFVLTHEERPDNTEVSISFVSNEEITVLNESYRGMQGPTDVLSFECDGAPGVDELFFDEVMQTSPVFELGDIIIAPDVAQAQCEQYGNTFEQELSLLITHGLLHLCGYDHMEEPEALEMEAREKELLSEWFNMEFQR